MLAPDAEVRQAADEEAARIEKLLRSLHGLWPARWRRDSVAGRDNISRRSGFGSRSLLWPNGQSHHQNI